MLDKEHFNNLVGKTQCERIKYWFENIKLTITQSEADIHLGIKRLASRIGELESREKADIEHTRKYSPHNNQYTKGRKR